MKKYTKPILVFALLSLAGAANGWMDALQFHGAWQQFENPEFWNPAISWKNKWATSPEGVLLVGTERFWGSSRWFVALTDAWHLIKSAWLTCVTLAVVVAASSRQVFEIRLGAWQWVALAGLFILARLAMSTGFFLTYSIIFK